MLLTKPKPQKPERTYVTLKGEPSGQCLSFTVYEVTPEQFRDFVFQILTERQRGTQHAQQPEGSFEHSPSAA